VAAAAGVPQKTVFNFDEVPERDEHGLGDPGRAQSVARGSSL
jgi:hypothetical protein